MARLPARDFLSLRAATPLGALEGRHSYSRGAQIRVSRIQPLVTDANQTLSLSLSPEGTTEPHANRSGPK